MGSVLGSIAPVAAQVVASASWSYSQTVVIVTFGLFIAWLVGCCCGCGWGLLFGAYLGHDTPKVALNVARAVVDAAREQPPAGQGRLAPFRRRHLLQD
eukprot:2330953-Amphidinium_carterae.1